VTEYFSAEGEPTGTAGKLALAILQGNGNNLAFEILI
jgi:hypothetical protein